MTKNDTTKKVYSFDISEEYFEKIFKKLADEAGYIRLEVSYNIIGDESNDVRLTLKCESECEKLQVEKILQEGLVR